MNRYHTLILGFLFFLSLPTFAAADADSKVVCGVAIDSVDSFSWQEFKLGPGRAFLVDADRSGLLAELKSLLIAESTEWPEDIRLPALRSLSRLIDGSADYLIFTISPIVRLQKTQVVFLGDSENQVELPLQSNSALCADPKYRQARIELARFANLVRRSGAELSKPSIDLAARRLKSLEETYDKYLYQGFPMFPWEALANSWLLTNKSIADGPPRKQLVFMHPAAGLVGATGSDSDSDLGASLSLEPLGWVYYSKDYTNWYGASLLAVFPGDRNAGVGLVLNYKEFKLGVSWHDHASGDNYDNPSLFLGMELYQLISKERRKYTGYLQKVKTLR